MLTRSMLRKEKAYWRTTARLSFSAKAAPSAPIENLYFNGIKPKTPGRKAACVADRKFKCRRDSGGQTEREDAMKGDAVSDFSGSGDKLLRMAEKPSSPFRNLLRHVESVETETTAVSANCSRISENELRLFFSLRGRIENIMLPERRIGERTDRLWEATCFELFLKRAGVKAYTEVNLSPAHDWAVFRFDGYRINRRDDLDAQIIGTTVEKSADKFSITTRVIFPGFAEAACEDVRIGLSAIILDRAGAKSFWALAHPPGAPDFHHNDCFIGAITENQKS